MARARSSRGRSRSEPALPAAQAGGKTRPSCLAYTSARVVIVFLALTGVGLAADLVTKHAAFAALIDSPGLSTQVIPGFLRLTLSTNRGIVFGIEVPPWLVLAATAGAVVVVTWLFATSPRGAWGLHAALAMVLGGSVGNAYDRLFGQVWFPGEPAPRLREVRDFIEADLHFMTWPVFNVADALLVVGVGLIVLHILRTPRGAPG